MLRIHYFYSTNWKNTQNGEPKNEQTYFIYYDNPSQVLSPAFDLGESKLGT